ncbi:MAG: YlzJ-like family protein [Firmicutes bacterium]|nr:YlzJ-like family protein [Bacillota bacterium]
MIWSIIPENVIFAAGADTAALRQIGYLGRKVLVRQVSAGRGEIVALLSTDPADFLSPRLAPGSFIDLF